MWRTVFLAILVLPITSISQSATPQKYDGDWWLSQPPQVREVFLWGYCDCLVDSIGNKFPPDVDESKLIEEITKFYASGGRLSERVSTVMKLLWERHRNDRPMNRTADAEVWTDKHGFFDGMYWLGGEESEHVGFVSGLLDCFNNEPRSRAKLSRAPTEYVQRLNEWYEGAMKRHDQKGVKTKIANVLLLFAEKKARRQQFKTIH